MGTLSYRGLLQCARRLAWEFVLPCPSWMMVGSIYGTPGVVRAVRKEIRKRARKSSSRMIFASGGLLKLARIALAMLPETSLQGVRRQLATLHSGIDIMLGQPNQVALPLAYWRHPTGGTFTQKEVLNPAKDGCGLLWYAPLVAMKQEVIARFIDFVRQTCHAYQIEPLITLTNLRHDLTDSTIPILFNPTDSEAAAQAKACLNALVEKGLQQGFIPYRLNIEQQSELLDRNEICWQLVSTIKQRVDPEGVIAPGRYQP